jgi:hypothetical protein
MFLILLNFLISVLPFPLVRVSLVYFLCTWVASLCALYTIYITYQKKIIGL